ncbi:MAG: ATP synthase F1 subunit delta [Candidatus Krumholzibacteriota bacterium]|nr:ATP synthase F1 subunit delta [Candidatus Krumholzibacteriota bacterium]
MRHAAIARVYAAALLELARERGEPDALAADLRDLRAALADSPTLRGVLECPEVSGEAKDRILAAVAEGARTELTPRFLRLVVERHREPALLAILEMFEHLRDVEAGRLRGRLRTARPLAEEDRRRLEEALGRSTGREVRLSVETEPDLLAGLVLHLADRMVDGSLRSRLARLRDRLLTAELGRE